MRGSQNRRFHRHSDCDGKRRSHHANPPFVKLRIERVINGSPPKGTVRARWSPGNPWQFLCVVGEEEAMARWGAESLAGPRPRERLMLVREYGHVEYAIAASCARPPTRLNIRRAKAAVARSRAVEQRQQRDRRERFAAERRAQKKANLEALYSAADVVVLVRHYSATGSGEANVEILRRFKDPRPDEVVNRRYAKITFAAQASRQFDRFSLSWNSVLFLRNVEDGKRGAAESEVVDPRHYVPVDDRLSVLNETKGLLEFLERRSRLTTAPASRSD